VIQGVASTFGTGAGVGVTVVGVGCTDCTGCATGSRGFESPVFGSTGEFTIGVGVAGVGAIGAGAVGVIAIGGV